MSTWARHLPRWGTTDKSLDDPGTRAGRAGRGQAGGATPSIGYDQAFLGVVVALLLWGLVMVYSASIALPDNPRFARYSHTYFLWRHAL